MCAKNLDAREGRSPSRWRRTRRAKDIQLCSVTSVSEIPSRPLPPPPFCPAAGTAQYACLTAQALQPAMLKEDVDRVNIADSVRPLCACPATASAVHAVLSAGLGSRLISTCLLRVSSEGRGATATITKRPGPPVSRECQGWLPIRTPPPKSCHTRKDNAHANARNGRCWRRGAWRWRWRLCVHVYAPAGSCRVA